MHYELLEINECRDDDEMLVLGLRLKEQEIAPELLEMKQ